MFSPGSSFCALLWTVAPVVHRILTLTNFNPQNALLNGNSIGLNDRLPETNVTPLPLRALSGGKLKE